MEPKPGLYQLTYTPTTWYDSAYVEPTIQMTISSEADLEQMLAFFDSFLKASGYVYKGKLAVNAPKLENTIGWDGKNFYPSSASAPSSGISAAACPSTPATAIGKHFTTEQ